jgi:hypothetical protein
MVRLPVRNYFKEKISFIKNSFFKIEMEEKRLFDEIKLEKNQFYAKYVFLFNFLSKVLLIGTFPSFKRKPT